VAQKARATFSGVVIAADETLLEILMEYLNRLGYR
jgi:hypothetical protein